MASSSEGKTRTSLIKNRIKEQIPDITFDLDGDGLVNNRDYFLAKRFDKDGDGRLNSQERKTAIEALKNGYEDNFYWNVEKSGAHRGKRLLQVRGKIVEAENFSGIPETYPENPFSRVKPKITTYQELKSK